MCYFVSISVNFKIIEDRFNVRFVAKESFSPVYSASAFTFPKLPVITNADPDKLQLFRWGLIPHWVKDMESARKISEKTLNARAETIFEKPSFRSAIITKRCLVPVDGFFEWRHEGDKNYPYHIRMLDRSVFALAGIWDIWQNPETGQIVNTFCIITTEANELLAKIHNTKKRMPVILNRSDEKKWLKPDLDNVEIQKLLVPCPAAQLEAYPVTGIVNKLGFNTTDPNVLEQKEYPDLPD